MSVTDPLIKELKAYTAKFLDVYKNNECVGDEDGNLAQFCACLEKIFAYGIIPTTNSFGFIRHNDTWTWIEKAAQTKYDLVPYNFVSSVENSRTCKNVFTNTGRFRLVVRYCLVRKCLHVPVEYMMSTGQLYRYYDPGSIMGDEILSEIVLSVLYQCSKINFKLDLMNTSFLDLSWLLPEVVRVELVPAYHLGMSVSFAGEKAIIVKIRPNSVCAECTKVSVGDVLDTLNGICICSTTKGRLSSLLKCQKGRPINLTVIKAMYPGTRQYYPPIVKLFKEIDLDPDLVKSEFEEKVAEDMDPIPSPVKQKRNSPGFKIVYVGVVDVGRSGDVKLIDKAFNVLFSPNPSYSVMKCKKVKAEVQFEVGELGVKCLDRKTQEILLKHSFMEISACGSILLMPTYFAYIAGDDTCTSAKNFKCYIFMATNDETAYTILQGIGQGFQRTHYAV